jgi:hypothetical protein
MNNHLFPVSIRAIACLFCMVLLASCMNKTVPTAPATDPSSVNAPPGMSSKDPVTPPESSPPAVPKTTPDGPSKPADTSKPLVENNAFRLFEPAPNSTVNSSFTVKGQARVFEAAFSYSFEDGHNVLAEGHAMAKQGAPEWGDFEFVVQYNKATNPTGMLILYETSAKDGSRINQLVMPVKLQNIVPLQ